MQLEWVKSGSEKYRELLDVFPFILFDNERCYVVTENDKIMGWALIHIVPTRSSLVVSWLRIMPEHRRKGAGSFLLGGLESLAYDYGLEWLRLTADMNQPVLRRFYRKNRFFPEDKELKKKFLKKRFIGLEIAMIKKVRHRRPSNK